MRLLFIIVILFSTFVAHAQKQIVVHFLYGSTPAIGFEKMEKKRFGGLKGGHVSIEAGDSIIGFQPKGTCHVIGKKKYCNGYFRADNKTKWIADSAGNKYTSIVIPVSDSAYHNLKTTLNSYLTQSPYDYAFMGMRCAAATYDILEKAGLVNQKSNFSKWTGFFYPQLFRRYMLKKAKENNYSVVKHTGRSSRNWEME